MQNRRRQLACSQHGMPHCICRRSKRCASTQAHKQAGRRQQGNNATALIQPAVTPHHAGGGGFHAQAACRGGPHGSPCRRSAHSAVRWRRAARHHCWCGIPAAALAGGGRLAASPKAMAGRGRGVPAIALGLLPRSRLCCIPAAAACGRRLAAAPDAAGRLRRRLQAGGKALVWSACCAQCMVRETAGRPTETCRSSRAPIILQKRGARGLNARTAFPTWPGVASQRLTAGVASTASHSEAGLGFLLQRDRER